MGAEPVASKHTGGGLVPSLPPLILYCMEAIQMSRFDFHYMLPDGIKLRIEVDVDEFRQLQEWGAYIETPAGEADFTERLDSTEQDDITQAAWDELIAYMDHRRRA